MADTEFSAAPITTNALESLRIVDRRQDASAVVYVAEGTWQGSFRRQRQGVPAKVLNLSPWSAETPEGRDQFVEYRKPFGRHSRSQM